MFLNAFGVESDGFPTINAKIDFVSDSSLCEVSYYEPWLKMKQYSFSKQELDTLRTLLTNTGLKKKNIAKDQLTNQHLLRQSTQCKTLLELKIMDFKLNFL